MDELRDVALGRGWRKLVADGVAATPIDLRRGPAVKIVDGVRTETVTAEQWPARLDLMLSSAQHVHVHAPTGDLHARRTKRGRWLVSRGKPSTTAEATREHDRVKAYPIADDHPLFRATRSSPAKRRQVQRYLDLVRTLPVWSRERIRVVDAGCGKAYLSLALVALGRQLGVRVELVGLDSNPSVVDTVRGIAGELGYGEAQFEATSIGDFASNEPIDLLVSLHACDTATDEAIAAGVRLGAEAIVVAPCCHHELAAQIASQPADALLRHGLLLGRQADLITDALRAAALESVGYRVDVVEFVAAEHTAKNLLLRAERAPSRPRAERALGQYRELRDAYAVDPAIGRLLGGELRFA